MSRSDTSLAIANAAFAVLFACGVTMLLTHCAGAAPGLPTQADFARYSIQQGICVEVSGTKADTLSCLHDTRLLFCTQFPAVCPADGGAQ